jgi:hypothetical protein
MSIKNWNAGIICPVAIFAGGNDDVTGATNVIQYVTIATTSNSTYFGDLTAGGYQGAACSGAAAAVQ